MNQAMQKSKQDNIAEQPYSTFSTELAVFLKRLSEAVFN